MRASGYERRTDDYYVEPPWIVDARIGVETFGALVYDPSCGAGNIPKRFLAHGIDAVGSDIRDRGYGDTGIDWIQSINVYGATDIVSNPPYGIAQEWIEHSLTQVAGKVAIITRLAFLESTKRKTWFRETGLTRVWVSSKRVSMPPGESGIEAKGGAIAYAWYVWEVGYKGLTTLGWL